MEEKLLLLAGWNGDAKNWGTIETTRMEHAMPPSMMY